MEATWIDLMPAIPLARGVPVVRAIGGGVIVPNSDGHLLVTIQCGGFDMLTDDWRVDLDDPQGFGYALRWLRSTPDGVDIFRKHSPGGWMPLLLAWVEGSINDDDRLALANACAEVAS